MAIDRYGANQVNLAPESNARVVAADFGRGGEMIGKALESFGGAIGDAAKAHEQIIAKHDEAAVRQADAEDALTIMGIKQKALSAQGMDAQAAIADAKTQIEEVGKARQASFSSGRQRAMYADVFSRRSLGVQEQLGEHASKQTEVAHAASLDATIDSSSQVAIDSHSDPVEFERNIASIDQAIEEKYKGMPSNAIARAKQIAKSNVHAGVVEQILSDPDNAGDAAIYLRDHAAEIDPDTETKLWKQVNPVIKEERTASDATWAMSGAPAADSHHTPEDAAPDPLAAKPDADPVKVTRPTAFVDPLRGRGKETSGFNDNRPGGRKHQAQDIAAPAGTPVYPPMSGTVEKNWWSAEGGWSLLVKHPNGMVTGYAHLRSRSALDVGQEVDPSTIMGGVGNTGAGSHGNHLHFTVRRHDGEAKIDPNTLLGGQVDPKAVSWKEGALPEYKPEDTNIASALGRLHDRATRERWSPSRYVDAVKQVQQMGNANQALYNDGQRRLADTVYSKLAEADAAGKPLTRVADLGPNFGALDGHTQATLTNLVQANAKAAAGLDADGHVKANGETYSTLALAAADPSQRQEFIATNFDRVLDITSAERVRLKLTQKHLQNDETGTLAAHIDRNMSAINRYLPQAGLDVQAKKGSKVDEENQRKRGILLDRTNALAQERQQQLGRPLTDTELDGIVRSQVVAIHRGGETRPLYLDRATPHKPGEVGSVDPRATFDSIPIVAKQSITAALQRRGLPVTPRNVIEAYLEGSR